MFTASRQLISPQQTNLVLGAAQMHHWWTLWGSSSGGKLSPPHQEKGEKEGEGKEGEPMYIDREDMGKEKTPSEIEKEMPACGDL